MLARLLAGDSYDISATTRRDGHAEKLRSLGCRVHQASLDDSDAIIKAVAESDIVINTASSDHPASVESTLKAIRQRSSAGKKTIYMCARRRSLRQAERAATRAARAFWTTGPAVSSARRPSTRTRSQISSRRWTMGRRIG